MIQHQGHEINVDVLKRLSGQGPLIEVEYAKLIWVNKTTPAHGETVVVKNGESFEILAVACEHAQAPYPKIAKVRLVSKQLYKRIVDNSNPRNFEETQVSSGYQGVRREPLPGYVQHRTLARPPGLSAMALAVAVAQANVQQAQARSQQDAPTEVPQCRETYLSGDELQRALGESSGRRTGTLTLNRDR